MESEVKALKMDMRLIMTAVFINIKTIILFGVFGFVVSLVVMLIPIGNMYTASAAVCSTIFNDNWDNTKSVRLMSSFIDIFESSLIQDRIIEIVDKAISRNELLEMTKLKQTASKTILTITTQHSDPAVAIKTANTIAHILIIETDKLYETPSGIKILDKANTADYAYRGSNIYIIISLLLTLLSAFGCCMYFIYITLASDKVLFIEDCTMDGSLEIMGVIPYSVKKQQKKKSSE